MYISKNKSIFLAVLICVIAAVSAAVPIAVNAFAENKTYKATVVVDAGHGGADGGVVGSSGVKESELNLKVAKLLAKELTDAGYKVVMTREDENALAEGKKADMQARKKVIENAKPHLIISIHMNKFSSKARRGAQVFYDDAHKWEKYGNYFQQVLNRYINAKYTSRSNYEAIGGDYFMTKCYDAPSLIVECGFLSNGEDEALLNSDAYRKELASVLCGAAQAVLEPSFGRE